MQTRMLWRNIDKYQKDDDNQCHFGNYNNENVYVLMWKRQRLNADDVDDTEGVNDINDKEDGKKNDYNQ